MSIQRDDKAFNPSSKLRKYLKFNLIKNKALQNTPKEPDPPVNEIQYTQTQIMNKLRTIKNAKFQKMVDEELNKPQNKYFVDAMVGVISRVINSLETKNRHLKRQITELYKICSPLYIC